MDKKKDKKVAIVTGSASGIGAATAVELSRRGWSVLVNYSKSREKAEQVQKKCPGSILVQADVGDDAACRKLAQAAIDKWGRIDALVNNAGTTKFVKHADLDGLSAEDFLRIYRSNVVGPFQMARACAPALNSMTYSLARVLGPEIRVNAVLPGFVDTPWQSNALGAEKANQAAAHYSTMVPLKDYARPEDVADAIVWLIEGARQVTGETIFIDGGMHIATPR